MSETAQPALVLSQGELRDALRQIGVAAIMNNDELGRELEDSILGSHAALVATLEQLSTLLQEAVNALLTHGANDEAAAVEDQLQQIFESGAFDEERGFALMQAGAFLVGLRITLERLPADPLAQTPVSRAFLETVEETVARLSGERIGRE